MIPACAQSTGEKKGRWLENGERVADSKDRKSVGGFGAFLVVVKDPDEWIKQQLRPEQPNFDTAETVMSGDKIGIFVLFAGCKPNSKGVCDTKVDYIVKNPKGEIILDNKGGELWNETAPPAQNTHFGKAHIRLEMQKSNLKGEYKIWAKVYDGIANVSFELETQFSLEYD